MKTLLRENPALRSSTAGWSSTAIFILLLLLSSTGPAQTTTPIDFGQSIIGNLPLTSSTASYATPTARPGDVFLVRGVTPGLIVLKVDLYAPSGQLLASYTHTELLDYVHFIYRIPPSGETGSYKFIVSGTDGFFTGPFCLSLERMNTPPNSTFLGCNNSVSEAMDCQASFIVMRYLMEANSVSSIKVSPNGLVAPQVWIGDDQGNVLRYASADRGEDLTIDGITAPYSGCYYVFATDTTATFSSGVNISHTIISGACAAVAISLSDEDALICEGASFTLTATSSLPATQFVWTGPNGFSSTEATLTFSNATPVLSGVYTVTADAPGACASTTSKAITVKSPTATAGVSLAELCAGTSFTLNVTTDAANPTFVWTGPNGYSSTSRSPTVSTSADAPTERRVYEVKVTDGRTGCSRVDSVAVQVNGQPTAIILAPTPGVCLGSVLSLQVSTDTPDATYSWTGPGGFTSTVQNPIIPDVALTNQGTYRVTVTNTTTGCSHTDSESVTVLARPTATITGDLAICAGETTTLTASGGGVYRWSNGGATAAISVRPAQTTTYTVTVTNPTTGCTDTENTTVIVTQLPSVAIASTPIDPEICAGSGAILLCATSDAHIPTYQWASTNFSATGQCVVFDKPAQSATYQVSVMDGLTGCANTDTSSITIHATPNVNILRIPEPPYCQDDNDFTLCATSDASNPVYRWTGPANLTGAELCLAVNDANAAQSGTYTVIVTASSGCADTAMINVDIATPFHCVGEIRERRWNTLVEGGRPPYRYTLLPGGAINENGSFQLSSSGPYQVEVTDSIGCHCVTDVIIGTTDPVKEWGIRVAPNPGKGTFIISVPVNPKPALRLSLFDGRGRQLRQFIMEAPTMTFDLTDLPAGPYLLRISDGEKLGTLRLVLLK